MAQQGKGSLIRIGALIVVLLAVGAAFLYLRQTQGDNLNTVQGIETYVNSGGLIGKSLDEVKDELDHDNPVPKEGETDVYLFDMTEKDPSLGVVVEVVIRGGRVNAFRTFDMEGRQTGTQGATDDG